MTQFEKSDVMLKYAELMQDQPLIKTAWTWRDIVTELGIGAAVDAAAVVGGAAAWGAITGAGLGSATTVGTGAAAGAAAAMGGPIVWAVLGGAAISTGIWYLTRQMDDNIDDLVDRLEDLDVGDTDIQRVNGWVQSLNQFKQAISSPPTTTDVTQRAKLVGQQYMALKGLDSYLTQMKTEWPSVKSNLSDWVFDDAQAEYAINTTAAKIKETLANIKKQVQAATQEMIKKVQRASDIDYTVLAQSVFDLYTNLTRMSGDCPPKFDTQEEKAAWSLANKILGKSKDSRPLTPQDIKVSGPLMQKLKALLEQGIKITEQKQTTKPQEKKSSAVNRPLSKRALTLCDGTEVVMPGEKGSSVGGKGGKPGKGRSITKKLQQLINTLNTKYNPDMTLGKIREDGIYGPNTAAALTSLLLKRKDLAEKVSRGAGVGVKTIRDFRLMRKSKNLVRAVYNALISSGAQAGTTPSGTGRDQKGAGTAGETAGPDGQPEQDLSSRVRCRPDKHDPTSDEIISCLKNYFKVRDPQTDEWMYAYYWLNTLKIYNEDTMVRLISDQFPPGRYRPMDWSPAMFVSYVMNRLGGRHSGKVI